MWDFHLDSPTKDKSKTGGRALVSRQKPLVMSHKAIDSGRKAVTCMAWHPDGTVLATGERDFPRFHPLHLYTALLHPTPLHPAIRLSLPRTAVTTFPRSYICLIVVRSLADARSRRFPRRRRPALHTLGQPPRHNVLWPRNHQLAQVLSLRQHHPSGQNRLYSLPLSRGEQLQPRHADVFRIAYQ